MNTLTEKLKKVSSNDFSFGGEVILFSAIKRTDLEERWDLIFSATEITDENSQDDLKSFIEILKKVIATDINYVASILLLPSNNNLVIDIANSIKEFKLEAGYSGTMKISDNFFLKEINLIIVNVDMITTKKSFIIPKTSVTTSTVFD